MMDYLEYDIMSRYPLLSASEDLKKWTGFISTKTRVILLSLAVPQFPTCENLYLDSKDLDWKTVNFWNLILEQISVADCSTLLDFLEVLKQKFLEETTEQRDCSELELGDSPTTLTSSDLYSAVIDEVEMIGLGNVTSLSSDFKELVINYTDMSKRKHELKLSIPAKYPDAKPKVVSELPFPPESLKWNMRIQDIHKSFVTLVDKCCKFWDDMDELDAVVKVVEPLQPSRSHYHRRIMLEDDVVIHLVFDAIAPRKLPAISFSGPEKIAERFNSAMDVRQELKLWDETLKVTENLKSILNCQFATKEPEEDEGESELVPCTVCFVYCFDDQIPEVTCGCEAVFHKQCLQDLFVSDVGMQGITCRRTVACPNCETDITVHQRLGFVSW